MGTEKLEANKVALRIQDIQTSTQDVDLGYLSAETKTIRLVGMAERLAIHIRGADVIKDYKKLEYIGSQFGVEPLLMPNVLEILQEVGWVRVETRGENIIKVEESVPYFNSIYTSMGQYFEGQNPTEIENGLIAVCDSLASSPLAESQVRDQLGGEDKAYNMIMDIGKSGKIIDEYDSSKTKEKIVYSPLFWVENPKKLEQMFGLLKKYGADRVYEVLKKIRDYQGCPLGSALLTGGGKPKDEIEIVSEVIKRGIILAPEVTSLAGRKNFAFSPVVNISIEEKVILEKAMAILSCVRYGQHFGQITKIRSPELILYRLLNSPHRIGSHSEIRKQYSILAVRGIGKIFPDSSRPSRYYFELIQTKENIKAAKLARDLLQVGEVIENKGLSPELQQVLFCSGSYEEALRTLPKVKQRAQLSSATAEHCFSIMNDTMDLLRGDYA